MNQTTEGVQVHHTVTRACVVLSICAGIVSLVGFAAFGIALGGSTLAVSVVCLAAASLLGERGSLNAKASSDDGEAAEPVAAVLDQVRLLRAEYGEMMQKLDQLGATQRRLIKVSVAQGDRVEEQNAAMSRRILADLNKMRVETADQGATAEHPAV